MFPAFFFDPSAAICLESGPLRNRAGDRNCPACRLPRFWTICRCRNPRFLHRFEDLISPKSDAEFEALAQESRALTLQNFGRTMRLFAPLYLSNECINNCRYCGFSRDNPILRVTLNLEQVIEEGRYLASEGFRQILLVAGEHPKFVSQSYLADCVARSGAGLFVYFNRGGPNGDG